MTLTIEQFGEALLKSGDLDPVYLAINGANLPTKPLFRICASYWCFYHLGAACKMSEAKTDSDWWQMMTTAAAYSPVQNANDAPWPRGAERRHFRGAQSVSAMAELAAKYKNAEAMVLGMLGPNPRTYQSVARAVQSHRGFGTWISFKIADMAERVLHQPVDFSDCDLNFYDDPRKGAALYWYEAKVKNRPGAVYDDNPWDYPVNKEEMGEAVNALMRHFTAHHKKQKAGYPGLRHRTINVQEVETVLCKYKSYRRGHYPPGKDTREVLHGLAGWGKTAAKLELALLEQTP